MVGWKLALAVVAMAGAVAACGADGTSWADMTSPGTDALYAVHAFATDDVWVGGGAGERGACTHRLVAATGAGRNRTPRHDHCAGKRPRVHRRRSSGPA